MSEQELPQEESEEEEEETPKTGVDNVENPDLPLKFDFLLKTSKPSRSAKHPWIKVKTDKKGVKLPSFASFLKNPKKPS